MTSCSILLRKSHSDSHWPLPYMGRASRVAHGMTLFFIKMMCNHKVLGIGAVLGQNPGKTLLFSKQNRWQMDVPPETYETYEQRINAWLFFVNDQGIMVTMNDQISMVSQPQLPTSANHPVLFMCFSMVFWAMPISSCQGTTFDELQGLHPLRSEPSRSHRPWNSAPPAPGPKPGPTGIRSGPKAPRVFPKKLPVFLAAEMGSLGSSPQKRNVWTVWTSASTYQW